MTAKQKTTKGSLPVTLNSKMALSGRSSDTGLEIYRYDAFNRLTNYNSGSDEASYTYSANNLRASKTVNRERMDFVWNGQNLAAESRGEKLKTYTYDITGVHIANQNGTITSYLKDYHGNVIGKTTKTGAMFSEMGTTMDYDAFGNQWQGDAPDPFGYCGEYLDSESGLIYLRNRYYDSTSGRFITEDPVKDGLNWYSYCGNNPVNWLDRSGLKPEDIFETMDDAAMDAGNYLLEMTYDNDQEMLAVIYAVEGGFTYYETPNIDDNPMYSFTVMWDETPLALVHTHVYYNVDHPNNILSNPDNTTGSGGGSDTNFTDTTGVIIYGAMPTGELRVYRLGDENKNGTLISSDLIVDPKYTTYQSYKNTLIWNLLDKKYPEIDKMDIVKAKVKYPDSLYNVLKDIGIIK